MNVVIKSEPKDMDSEELAKCLEAGADYKLYTPSPMRAYMHGIDMEHWLRASADRIRTLTAEVERLRGLIANANIRIDSMTVLEAVDVLDNVVQHFYESGYVPCADQDTAERAVEQLRNAFSSAMTWEPMTDEAVFAEGEGLLVRIVYDSDVYYDVAYYRDGDFCVAYVDYVRSDITHFARIKQVGGEYE